MRGPKKRLTPFGKMVVKALADRDMSRAELAATVGTSPQYMSYILNGTRSGEKYLPGDHRRPRARPEEGGAGDRGMTHGREGTECRTYSSRWRRQRLLKVSLTRP